MSEYGKVLVVDDEAPVCQTIASALRQGGIACDSVSDAVDARRRVGEGGLAVLVCDVAMPDVSGMDLLELAKRQSPQTKVILVTGLGTIEQAKQAIRDGAYEYLEKPLDLSRLVALVRQAMGDDSPAEASGEVFASPEALIHAAAVRDALTGLDLPRALQEELTRIRLQAVQDRANASLILVNVDEFSEVNRIFGYAFGDEVLRQLAARIRGRLAGRGSLCRWRGDQFAVLLADADEAAARDVAEEVRGLAQRLDLRWQGHSVSVTLSAGLAESGAGFGLTEDELVDHARKALAAAKRLGGDAVCCYGQLQLGRQGAVELAAEELSTLADHTSQLDRSLRGAILESVRALATAVEAKDPYTHRHSEHVAYYAEQFARHVGLPGDEVETIRVAALVHDIGKIGIPDTILTKPGRLTDEEFEIIRQHPQVGGVILEKISLLNLESRLVRHHHERWDGKGYPDGLGGEAIPQGARIICLADSLDAMLMARTYKPAYPLEKVLGEVARGRGTQFDPLLADAAVEWLKASRDKIIGISDSAIGSPMQR